LDQPDSAKTLCIDIGGSHLKAAVVLPDGAVVGDEVRIPTPATTGPPMMVEAIAGFVAPLGAFDRVAVGFPGAVRAGVVQTAPNIKGMGWHNFPLSDALRDRFGKPVRLANDATVQGLGVIEGKGVECTITFGTGMGFALFEDGIPGPHLELSQHPARNRKTYDQYVGRVEHDRIGLKRWNKRVRRVIEQVRVLVNFDVLYIGGGNARHISFVVPPDVRIVPNVSGITGGIHLWEHRLDSCFPCPASTG
jgi:polyphosphate glucokinase